MSWQECIFDCVVVSISVFSLGIVLVRILRKGVSKMGKTFDLSGKVEFTKEQENKLIETGKELFRTYNGDEFLNKDFLGQKFIDIVIEPIRRK